LNERKINECEAGIDVIICRGTEVLEENPPNYYFVTIKPHKN
jgi:hypothetical protein